MTIRTMILTAALLAAGVGTALAQNGGPPPGGGGGRMMACRDDAQKLCPDKHGPDRRACMQSNKDKLSDGCKSAMAARAAGGGQ